MQAKKTLLAIALGTATLGASAYETEYGNAYADVKVRYETNDTDDATDNDAATGLTDPEERYLAVVEGVGDRQGRKAVQRPRQGTPVEQAVGGSPVSRFGRLGIDAEGRRLVVVHPLDGRPIEQ